MDSSEFENLVKRITVFVQSTSNADDLTARTFPATDKFMIPNASLVSERFTNIQKGYFNLSTPYTDILTSENTVELVGIRTSTQTFDGSKSIYFEV